jgi:hypothetical protein
MVEFDADDPINVRTDERHRVALVGSGLDEDPLAPRPKESEEMPALGDTGRKHVAHALVYVVDGADPLGERWRDALDAPSKGCSSSHNLGIVLRENVKTWDCFLINDELGLLEFRLRHLDPVVDRFVIVEGDRTHRGDPKPLHFLEGANRFEAWADKIVHVVARLPGPPAENAERERVQHEAMLDGLASVEPEDLVLVGDLDEMPRAEIVARLKDELDVPTRFVMRHCMYAANYEVPEHWRGGTKPARGRDLGSDEFDLLLGRLAQPARAPDRHWSSDAGWHLSYLGGPAGIKRKLRAYVHAEYDRRALRELTHLQRCLDYGVDFVGRFLLRPSSPHEFDPLLREYFAFAPHHFQLEALPAMPWRLAFRAWARLRAAGLPYSVVQTLETRMTLTLALAGPFLVAVDIGTRLARRRRLRHRILIALRRR